MPDPRLARRAATCLCRSIWFFLVLLTLAGPPPAAAQSVPLFDTGTATGVTAEQTDELLRTLEDPVARDRLIAQLRALQAVQQEPPQTVEPESIGAIVLKSLSEQVHGVSDAFVEATQVLLDAPDVFGWLAGQARDPNARLRWLELIATIAIVLLAALAAEWLVNRLLARPRRAVDERGSDSLWVQLPLLVLRLLIEMVPIVAFALVAYGVLPLTDPGQTTRLVTLAIVNANIIVRVVMAVSRTLLSARMAGRNLLHLSDETVNYALIWVRRLIAVSVYGYFLAEAALLLGLPPVAHALLMRALGLFVAAMIVVLILQNRTTVALWIKGEAAHNGPWGNLRQRLADIWHVLAIGYVAATYGVWALGIAGGFAFLLRATLLTVAVFAAVRVINGAIRHAVERGFALSAELKARYPGLEARANRYLPLLHRMLRIVIYAIAILLLLEIWGLNAFAWLASDLGRRLTGTLVTIALIVTISLALLEVVNGFVEGYLNRRSDGIDQGKRRARLRTLLPLMRTAFRIIIVVMVTLTVLSELGINIAPLLAGAGVVGLAIGFGAQTLVKDVITGIFILAEDTVGVGDVVDLGGPTGVVEALSIRSIRLRDAAGAVHTVPFSAVTTVRNMTKDYAFAVFDVSITYEEDIDRVTKVLQELGAELQEDPSFGWRILEPIEVLGLEAFGESALTIRARIKTRPIRQWDVAREFNRRMKQRFEEEGIVIPYPQRTVHYKMEMMPSADPASPPPPLPPSIITAAD